MVSRIQDTLEMAEITGEVVEREASGAELISERTCQAMRRCEAGIIVVGQADYEMGAEGEPVLRRSTLIEIGAARVHYVRRFILLLESRLPLPFNLDDFCHLEVEGGELTWETALRLVKSVKHFKADAGP